MGFEKVSGFFTPPTETIHIIGCGSVGSCIAEALARCGVRKFALYDFDHVESKNVANQAFTVEDVGLLKVDALERHIKAINPEATVRKDAKGWQGKTLSGYVFLAADSMDVRRSFVEKHMNNTNIKAVFDHRTALTFAQSYAADWSESRQRQALLDSMQHSDEEARAETPVSACGVVLGVCTTVRLISDLSVNNFISFTKGEKLKKFIQIDGFSYNLDAF